VTKKLFIYFKKIDISISVENAFFFTWSYMVFTLIFFYPMFLLQGAEDELKHAVAFVRPVSVAFEVVRDFRFYEKGIYTSQTCGKTPLVSPTNDYQHLDNQEKKKKMCNKIFKTNGLLQQIYAF